MYGILPSFGMPQFETAVQIFRPRAIKTTFENNKKSFIALNQEKYSQSIF